MENRENNNRTYSEYKSNNSNGYSNRSYANNNSGENRGNRTGTSDGTNERGQRRFRKPRRKICHFCNEKMFDIDYKDINKLKRFVTERGKIVPRRVSGNCAVHQRRLTIAIKRARHLALLPFSEG